MCGFFALALGMSAGEIAELFDLSNPPKDYDDLRSLKFYPKSFIPTISKNSPNQLVFRYWSLVPRWWKDSLEDIKFSTFNARSEDITEKVTYRTPWKQSQRCLIPATWFYEFEAVKDNGKVIKLPYRVQDERKEIITFAGLYETWIDKKGNELQSATIITCASKGDLAKIHDRQPVIIKEEDREKWLDKSTTPDEAYKLLKPDPDLEIHQIDRLFNKTFGEAVTEEIVKPLKLKSNI